MSDTVALCILGIIFAASVLASLWSNRHMPEPGSEWSTQQTTYSLTSATHAFLLVRHAHLIDPDSSRFSLVKPDDETWTWLLVDRKHIQDVYQSITEIDGQLCKVFVLTDKYGKVFIVNTKCVRTLYLLMATSSIDLGDLQIPTNDAEPLRHD